MAISQLLSINDIFQKTVFRVPDYQRGYAWGDVQLRELWDDLHNLELGRYKYHYAGLLTVARVEQAQAASLDEWQDDLWVFDEGLDVFYLIDGQQRLATIILLLMTIREQLSGRAGPGDQDDSDIFGRFVCQEQAGRLCYVFGYEKDIPSDEFFRTKVFGGESRYGMAVKENLYTHNIESAKRFFRDKTKDLDQERLAGLLNKVVNNLKLHLYELEEDVDVFVRFETINNRGRPLSTLALLKNRIIYLTTLLPLPEEQKSELRGYVNQVWKKIYEYIGKNRDQPLDEEKFLETHWVIYFDRLRMMTKSWSFFLLNRYFILDNLAFDGRPAPLDFWGIKDYLDSLAQSIETWFFMHNPHLCDYGPEIKKRLRTLNRDGFGPFRPLLLAALMQAHDEEELAEMMRSAHRYEVSGANCYRGRKQAMREFFHDLANNLHRGNGKMDIPTAIAEIDEQSRGAHKWLEGVLQDRNNYTAPQMR